MGQNDKSQKILILIRHAHRDTADRDQNNGLSDKGKEQVKVLTRTLQELYPLGSPNLISSPKRRCIETLQPIQLLTQVQLNIDSLLSEGQDNEGTNQLVKRVEQFCKKWKNQEHPLTLVCSHGDWLPLAVDYLVGAFSEFKKCGWAEIAEING